MKYGCVFVSFLAAYNITKISDISTDTQAICGAILVACGIICLAFPEGTKK